MNGKIKSQQHPMCRRFLADSIQVLHLNDNLIEHLPEDFFKNFRNLRDLKLERNPLKDPPQNSVCVSAPSRLRRNNNTVNQTNISKTPSRMLPSESTAVNLCSVSYLERSTADDGHESYKIKSLDSKSMLPSIVCTIENVQNLKPLQNYVVNFKNREGDKYI